MEIKTAQSQKSKGLINEASDAISGLLGNVDFKGLFRVLARPEFVAPMGPGQTPVTNFINAAAADTTAQAASRAAQQTAGLEGFKAETDRLKALMPDPSKMPKLTGEVNKCMISWHHLQVWLRLETRFGFRLIKVFCCYWWSWGCGRRA